MLAGAFFGIWASAESGSWVVGLFVAVLAGGTLALVHAFFSIQLVRIGSSAARRSTSSRSE